MSEILEPPPTLLLAEMVDTVVVITLNAPENRNALTREMREGLKSLLSRYFLDPECRAIVLTGSQGAFSSGGDLRAAGPPGAAPDPARTRHNAGLLHDIVRAVVMGPKPVVAAVDGDAFGAGFSVAAACDFIVAGDDARFCASFGKVGLMADAGLLWSLPQRVGAVRAKQLLLTGRVVKAPEALDIDLIDVRAPAGSARSAAIELARDLTRLAPLAVAAMKSVIGRGPQSLESILAMEAELQPLLSISTDYAEGRAAFFERRPTVFKGR